MTYQPFNKFWSEDNFYRFLIHQHEAKRAGLHYDLRMETDNVNAIASFASRKLLGHISSNNPGRILLFDQDIHGKSWINTDIKIRKIKEGYGAGEIKLVGYGKLKVIEVKENIMKFILKVEKVEKDFTKKLKQTTVFITFIRYNHQSVLSFSKKNRKIKEV